MVSYEISKKHFCRVPVCAKIKPVDILLQCDYCSPRSPNVNVGTKHGPTDFTQTGFFFALPLRSMASVIFNIEIGGVGGSVRFATPRKCSSICFMYRGRSSHKSNEIPFHGKVFLGCLLQFHSPIFGMVAIYHCLPQHVVD